MPHMTNQIVKEQFNKQAEKFANWSIGKNIEYLNGYFDFCEIQPTDRLLDVACGPGVFTIFIAKRISETRGVDISDREIELANELIKEFGLSNVSFDCSDVERLPYNDNTYSIVVCKSAFHHFVNPESVFKEMIRCCEKGGKISIQDIVAYEDDYVNDFFETFDKLIDISHNRTLSELEFNKLHSDHKINMARTHRRDVDLNVKEYLEHAIHDEENQLKIDELLKKGQEDNRLSDFLFIKDNDLYFKRPVYFTVGIK
jgi:ubiquinone/menaquinone biosynthesis C-methylase UbiE